MLEKGLSLKAAKTSAARIFNSTRKKNEAPVTGKHKKKKKTKPGAVDDNAMKRVKEYYKKVREMSK